jgi:hypothetical protein
MAVTQLRPLVAGFPPWRPGLEPRSRHVAFVVENVALGQVLYDYYCSHANSYSIDCSTLVIIHHRDLIQ